MHTWRAKNPGSQPWLLSLVTRRSTMVGTIGVSTNMEAHHRVPPWYTRQTILSHFSGSVTHSNFHPQSITLQYPQTLSVHHLIPHSHTRMPQLPQTCAQTHPNAPGYPQTCSDTHRPVNQEIFYMGSAPHPPWLCTQIMGVHTARYSSTFIGSNLHSLRKTRSDKGHGLTYLEPDSSNIDSGSNFISNTMRGLWSWRG